MAAGVPKRIGLKLLMDKENNRLIFAEAESNFVDIIFSFLTLPVGTVIRLLSEQSLESELGCMHNLYRSVENLDEKYFWGDMCKTMLLHTRNSSADICRKLEVNIDNTEPLKYYVCERDPYRQADHKGLLLSTFCGGQCGCGEELTTEILLSKNSATVDKVNGVFLNALGSFIITDDLQIMPLSAETTFGLLNNLGVRAEALEVKAVDFSHEEATRLLKHMLFSNASLTDTFLPKQRVSRNPKFEETREFSSTKDEEVSDIRTISLNLVVQKSNNKIICAEAGDDFVSFLMSILTFPLGAVVKLLGGLPALRSISNMYKSVEGLSIDKYLKSMHHKELLLSPKICLQCACKYQLLDIVEAASPTYFYNYSVYIIPHSSLSTTKDYGLISTDDRNYSKDVNFLRIEGFVREPMTFMVTDALEVTPFSSMSTITILQRLQVPIDDVEMRVLSIGYTEALQILGAAMTSKTALTTAFGSISRNSRHRV